MRMALRFKGNIDDIDCPFCHEVIVGFRDELSAREWTISGLCQKCQDKTFREDYGYENV